MGFGGILVSDVRAALCNGPGAPLVLGLMAGYGGREVTLEGVDEIVTLAERALERGRVDEDCTFLGLRPEILPEGDL